MLRFFLLLTLSICFFSCNKTPSQENPFSEKLTFTLDTVWVDSGEDFIFLRDNLFLSELSPDKSYLINFNRMETYAERINLDELKLESRIQFEKEGPDGIPSIISRFNITSEENLMVWHSRFYTVYDQNAKRIKDLELEKIVEPYLSGSEAYPLMVFEDPNQEDRVVGIFLKWVDKEYFLIDINLAKKEFKKTDLPDLAKTQEFSVDILFDGNWMGSYGVDLYALSTGDRIIVSNNSINEVLVYDFKGDSTYLKGWDTPLLGSKKNYQPPKQVEQDTGELEGIIKKIKEDIVYNRFTWDDVEKRFFRFSLRERFGEEKNEYGQYISTGADVFISIFDDELNLLAESLVPELTASPKRHFVKDGKIWIFENIGDELAFIRLKIM